MDKITFLQKNMLDLIYTVKTNCFEATLFCEFEIKIIL